MRYNTSYRYPGSSRPRTLPRRFLFLSRHVRSISPPYSDLLPTDINIHLPTPSLPRHPPLLPTSPALDLTGTHYILSRPLSSQPEPAPSPIRQLQQYKRPTAHRRSAARCSKPSPAAATSAPVPEALVGGQGPHFEPPTYHILLPLPSHRLSGPSSSWLASRSSTTSLDPPPFHPRPWPRRTSYTDIMMVPRSFRFFSPPPMDVYEEKAERRHAKKKTTPPRVEKSEAVKQASSLRTTSEPAKMPSKPVAVPRPDGRRAGPTTGSVPSLRSGTSSARRPSPTVASSHDPNALPPAIAALLAVTAIPPRSAHTLGRRKSSSPRTLTIDELVKEWKKDGPAAVADTSYSTSPALSLLLENADEDDEEQPSTVKHGAPDDESLHTRSTSCESVPSLNADNMSVLSTTTPSTPRSLRSRRSTLNLRKDRPRSLPTAEECHTDHPLLFEPSPEHGDPLNLPLRSRRVPTPKPKSLLKSNLTTSLQALKNAAINSISSLGLSNPASPPHPTSFAPFSDDTLWSHPFLFPRLTSEARPSIEGTPTTAQRRYLNPLPLTLEEQEAPFQQALHAPYLTTAPADDDAPTIQLQTYSRGRRRATPRRARTDLQSEAGRALGGPTGVRQREPRENSDFLRMVVLEMNMRRQGKLEGGRARIWLPPRPVASPAPAESPATDKIPRRWIGETVE